MLRLLYFFLSFLILLCSSSCTKEEDDGEDRWAHHTLPSLEYDIPFGISPSNLFSEVPEERGQTTLEEISGLAYSKYNPGYIWAHEDKNNPNALYLLDENTCDIVATYIVSGITNRDWEDIEIGPGPEPGKTYLYIGEIGDNDRVYPRYFIYRLEEPTFEESHRGQTITLQTDVSTITFQYPERRKHDSETLLLDPWTKDLFVVSKRSFFSIVYVLPFPQDTEEVSEAIMVAEFPFTRAVGGNISADGTEMLIKTYDHILHWSRTEGESMVDMIKKTPQLAPYNPVEPQGEAICFDPDKSYFTLSEFSNSIIPTLYYYQRIP